MSQIGLSDKRHSFKLIMPFLKKKKKRSKAFQIDSSDPLEVFVGGEGIRLGFVLNKQQQLNTGFIPKLKPGKGKKTPTLREGNRNVFSCFQEWILCRLSCFLLFLREMNFLVVSSCLRITADLFLLMFGIKELLRFILLNLVEFRKPPWATCSLVYQSLCTVCICRFNVDAQDWRRVHQFMIRWVICLLFLPFVYFLQHYLAIIALYKMK